MTTYPFKSGIPVPGNIGETLKKLPTNHFIWWVGQFAKFVLRLQLSQGEMMQKLKIAMKLDQPTVGYVTERIDVVRFINIKKNYFFVQNFGQEKG